VLVVTGEESERGKKCRREENEPVWFSGTPGGLREEGLKIVVPGAGGIWEKWGLVQSGSS